MAGDEDLVGPPQQVEEELDALLAGLGEDAGGKAGEGPAEDLDAVAGLEEVLLAHHARFVGRGSMSCSISSAGTMAGSPPKRTRPRAPRVERMGELSRVSMSRRMKR